MDIFHLYQDDDLVIAQDDIAITAAEFKKLSSRVAGYIVENFSEQTIIGIKSDNSVYGLIMAVGISLAGKHVLPLATINEGILNELLISSTGCKEFIGYGTELDHSDISIFDKLSDYTPTAKPGDFVFKSSGSTGKPKLHLCNLIRITPHDAENRNKLIFSKMPGTKNRAFYAAPLMGAGIGVLSFIAAGVVPIMTNSIPSTEIMVGLIRKYGVEMTTGRPTIIERFMAQGLTRMPGIKAFITSGSKLEQEHIDFCHNVLGVPHIVDCYVTSECGFIGVRDAVTEDRFTVVDDVSIDNITDNGFEISGMVLSGIWEDGELKFPETKILDDYVDYDGTFIKINGRTTRKIKVNGFSVSTDVIGYALKEIEDIVDFSFRVGAEKDGSSDIIVLEYTGNKYREEDLQNKLKKRLPFYAIPKKFVYKELEAWGTTK